MQSLPSIQRENNARPFYYVGQGKWSCARLVRGDSGFVSLLCFFNERRLTDKNGQAAMSLPRKESIVREDPNQSARG